MNRSGDTSSCSSGQETFASMEPECSLPCSQESATGLCAQPNESGHTLKVSSHNIGTVFGNLRPCSLVDIIDSREIGSLYHSALYVLDTDVIKQPTKNRPKQRG
jgi:hypothetical protein